MTTQTEIYEYAEQRINRKIEAIQEIMAELVKTDHPSLAHEIVLSNIELKISELLRSLNP